MARRVVLFLVAALLWPALSPVLWAEEFDLSKHSIPVTEILSGGPPKDGIPAILDPRFLEAEQATFLRDADLVIGVALNGSAKAYPTRILNWHEVVNDTIGDQPVAITWCPLTQSGIAFDRRAGGHVKTFGVSGRLYNSNVLIYDHQSESLWSQLAEAAVTGPSAGTPLTPVGSQLITWRTWRTLHPETLVLSTATGYPRSYQRNPYGSYLQDPGVMFPVNRQDTRLLAKAKVLGIMVNGLAKAYPLASLKTSPGPLVDTLGGQTLQVHRSTDGMSAFATDAEGRLLHGTVLYWFAWAAFHPQTLVYDQEPPLPMDVNRSSR